MATPVERRASVPSAAPTTIVPGPAARRRRASGLRRYQQRQGWLYAAPTALFVAVFFVVPVLLVIQMSLSDWGLFAGNRGFNAPDNYADAVGQRLFWPAVWFTVKYTIITTVILIGVALGLALLVQEAARWNSLPAHRLPGAERTRAGLGVPAVLRPLRAPERTHCPAAHRTRHRRRHGVVPRQPERRSVVHRGRDRLAVRGVLHAAAPGRPAGHLQRRLRGGRRRRGQPVADLRQHHAATAEVVAGVVHDLVHHRLAAGVRPVLHPDPRRPRQQHDHHRPAGLQRRLRRPQRPRGGGRAVPGRPPRPDRDQRRPVPRAARRGRARSRT